MRAEIGVSQTSVLAASRVSGRRTEGCRSRPFVDPASIRPSRCRARFRFRPSTSRLRSVSHYEIHPHTAIFAASIRRGRSAHRLQAPLRSVPWTRIAYPHRPDGHRATRLRRSRWVCRPSTIARSRCLARGRLHRTRPSHRFVQLRIRIPHVTAGFVCDPLSGASRRRCGHQAGRQRRSRNAARKRCHQNEAGHGLHFHSMR